MVVERDGDKDALGGLVVVSIVPSVHQVSDSRTSEHSQTGYTRVSRVFWRQVVPGEILVSKDQG